MTQYEYIHVKETISCMRQEVTLGHDAKVAENKQHQTSA